MRAMFIQHAKYRIDIPINIQQEINRKVLEFSVPRIISSLNMKRKYLNDIQKLPVPLEHSQSMSKGTKELELKDLKSCMLYKMTDDTDKYTKQL